MGDRQRPVRSLFLEAADLEAGDVLLAWERGEAARGEIASAFDWLWLVVEQAPRGTVVLTGERRREPVSIARYPQCFQSIRRFWTGYS